LTYASYKYFWSIPHTSLGDGELRQGWELQPQHMLPLQGAARPALGASESQRGPGRVDAPEDIIRLAGARPCLQGEGLGRVVHTHFFLPPAATDHLGLFVCFQISITSFLWREPLF